MKKKMRLAFLLLAVLILVFPVRVAYRYAHEQALVDDCLSGEHGSFDYSTMSCDFKENHAYVPYRVRHAHDKFSAVAALIIFVVLLWTYGHIINCEKEVQNTSR